MVPPQSSEKDCNDLDVEQPHRRMLFLTKSELTFRLFITQVCQKLAELTKKCYTTFFSAHHYMFGVFSNIAIDANTTDDGIIEVSKLTGSGGAIAVNLRRGHTSGTFSPLGNGASPLLRSFNIVTNQF